MKKIYIDPKIAHIVPADFTKNDNRIDEVFSAVESFMEAEGYSLAPTMGDDVYSFNMCKDENGLDGFISGNDWGNVREVLSKQLEPFSLEAEFVEFLGTAWFKIIKD